MNQMKITEKMSLGLKTWLVKEDRLRIENWQKYEVPDMTWMVVDRMMITLE